jgi:hypothetical protein
MLYRLLCSYAPSQVLMIVFAGAGTFILGVKFVAAFVIGAVLLYIGDKLDHYGQESHDA